MHIKRLSFIESLTQMLIGFIGSFIVLELMNNLLEIETSTQQNLMLVLAFTVWSIFRNFFVSSLFNKLYEEEKLHRSASRHFQLED